jgi:hypothetical protein
MQVLPNDDGNLGYDGVGRKGEAGNPTIGAAESGQVSLRGTSNGIDASCLAVLSCFPSTSSKDPPWIMLRRGRRLGTPRLNPRTRFDSL